MLKAANRKHCIGNNNSGLCSSLDIFSIEKRKCERTTYKRFIKY